VSNIKEVRVPDIGNFPEVDVIEVLVKEGDVVKAEDALVTLESDKATMDIPAPFAGKVKAIRIKAGEKAAEGTLILTMEVEEGASLPAAPAPVSAPAAASQPAAEIKPVAMAAPVAAPVATALIEPASSSGKVHASPSVRAFARELGVDLSLVNGSGPKRRILKEDVQAFVKAELAKPRSGVAGGFALGLPGMPTTDFSKFGAVEVKPLSKIKKI
jgi:pyruvate dehydrogenase E2 component (dihydrolipoamide acetyltransferase)